MQNDYPVFSMTSGLTVEYLITQGNETIEDTLNNAWRSLPAKVKLRIRSGIPYEKRYPSNSAV